VLVQRVLNTARLKGVTGSVAVRRKGEIAMGKTFDKMMNDVFEAKEKAGKLPVVTLKEIKGIFKKLAQNISLQVAVSDHGALASKFSRKKQAIYGYKLKLPLTKGNLLAKDDSEGFRRLDHEKSHFIRAIFQPKYSVNMIENKRTAEVSRKCDGFYDSTLYGYDFTGSNRELFMKDKAARGASVRAQIQEFFSKEALSHEEKIESLQSWRHGLKDELLAFKDSLPAYWGKKLKNNDAKSIKAMVNCTVNDEYFFAPKIKIVENILADEIAKVRAEQKRIFGQI